MTSKLKMEFCLIKVIYFIALVCLTTKFFRQIERCQDIIEHQQLICDYIYGGKKYGFFLTRNFSVKLKDYVKISGRADVKYICELWQKYGLKFKKAMGNEGLHTKKPHFFERNTIRIVFFCESQPRQQHTKILFLTFFKKKK